MAEQDIQVDVQAACETLGIPTTTFRKLLEEFSTELGATVQDGSIAERSLGHLARILQLRRDGLSDEAIRTAIQESTVPATEPETDLALRMEELTRTLARSEERRVEDRDRLMMALVRTQQEIRDLRHELTIGRRRDRRVGFWQRLLGRK